MIARRVGKATKSAAELARDLGVSPASVSYALNGRPGISDSLRCRIIDAAEEYGLAVKTRKRNRLLGLILADIGNPFYSELAASASEAARRAGYEVLLSHTDDEPDAIQSSVEAMIKHGVDGVMLTVVNAHDASLNGTLRRAGIPYVQISRHAASINAAFVGIDDQSAGGDVMNHLVDHGYRDIGIIAGPQRSSSSAARVQGMKKALRKAGIPLHSNRLLFTSLTHEGGIAAAEFLLEHRPLPRAVACGADVIALGLLDRLMREGVRCPEDIAITGYDGLTISLSRMLNMTTIIQPKEDIARAAVQELVQSASAGNPVGNTVLCGYSLHIGRTCGCREDDPERAKDLSMSKMISIE